jgi:hypothetical protein
MSIAPANASHSFGGIEERVPRLRVRVRHRRSAEVQAQRRHDRDRQVEADEQRQVADERAERLLVERVDLEVAPVRERGLDGVHGQSR